MGTISLGARGARLSLASLLLVTLACGDPSGTTGEADLPAPASPEADTAPATSPAPARVPAAPARDGVALASQGPHPFIALQDEKAGELGRRGLWREVRVPDNLLDTRQRETIARLEAIGYVSGSVEAPAQTSVTRWERGKTWDGVNFWVSGHDQEAILMDMEGRILHRWKHVLGAWPPAEQDTEKRYIPPYWRRAWLFPDGDVLAVYCGQGLVRLDKDSRVRWISTVRVHHDLEVQPDGTIYAISRKASVIPRLHPTEPILEDFVSVLSPEGEELRRVSLIEAFERSDYAWMLDQRPSQFTHGDIFHSNTVAVMDGRHAGIMPQLAAGNVLVSVRNLNIVALVDMEAEEVVWAVQGPFLHQHEPVVTDQGTLLVFNNHYRWAEASSAVEEYRLPDMQLLRRFAGSDAVPFFSRTSGTNQPLPNGNLLVTESDNGRVFELTPQDEIVWEFYNPFRAGEDGEYIAALFDMVRYGPDFPLDWVRHP